MWRAASVREAFWMGQLVVAQSRHWQRLTSASGLLAACGLPMRPARWRAGTQRPPRGPALPWPTRRRCTAALKRTATQPDAQVRAQQLGAGRAGAHGRCCPAREARWPATGAARGLGPPPGRDPPAARRSPPPPRGPTRA
ncbi:unnamed protein product, partial [Prorocentrum cordatum]